ncbi:hypothetical protein Tco_0335291 [Tanacetum coccineum]
MNPHKIQQVVARDEKWVPSTERVKISSTNVRLETTVPWKEETFQVIIDIIKNSTCFKAFTIFADVPEIFMQQFWYTIKKILDICPRVKGEEFTPVQDDDDTLTFLTDLGYKDPPKKRKGKGLQEKKTVDISQETVDVSEESKPEPAKKRMASKRVVKKKVTISADDNIILDPDVALELGKSISITEAEDEKAARQVHATHARIVTESVPKPAKKKTSSRSTKSVVIQDTPSAPKSKLATLKLKLKGILSLTPEEQLAADTMQALKEIKKPSKRQPGTRGSSEGTSIIPGVPAESTVVFATSSEGTGSKQESKYSEEELSEKEEIDWIDSEEDDKKKDDTDDDKSINLKMTDDEETDDEVLQGKEKVNDDEDAMMLNAKVEDSGKGDAEISNVAKADAEKTEEVKDESKKVELPPTSSSLSVSLCFGDQFLKLSSDTSLIGTVKDTTDTEISSLLDIKIQSEVPHIQSSSMLKVPVSVISEPSVLTPIQETPSAAPVTTLPPPSVSTIPPAPLQQSTSPIPLPPIITDALTITIVVSKSNALSVVQLRFANFEKDVSELKKIDHSAKALATLKSHVPTVIEKYLRSKISDDLQKVLQRHTADLIQKYSVKPAPESSKIQTPTINLEQESEKSASEILKIKKEQAKKQKMPKYTIKSTDKATLKEYDQKNAFYQTMHENKSFNRNPANHRLYHALMEALIEDENSMDKGVVDTVKDHKRKHDDDDYNDDDDEEDPSAGPNQSKKTKRRRTKESESSKKPSTTKETPKGKAPSKVSKTSKFASAKEPVEEPIIEVVMDDESKDVFHDDDQLQDTSEPKTTNTPNPKWFKKPPRPPTSDPEWNKRQVVLDQPEQPYALTNKLDWNNHEEDRYPYDLSKPLPPQVRPGHLTVAADYFFNNDLEYLKSSDPERMYTTSITKTKAARYKIVGIEDMQNVYSTLKILGVKSVSVKKLHGYGHLKEIVVKRVDRHLYKFKQGDFVNPHLNDIEDMLILAVQHKLFHLNESDIIDFIVALRMFTRSLVIKRRVEDLQLGVESYQKKLNITLPQQTFPEIEFKKLCTPSYKPLG